MFESLFFWSSSLVSGRLIAASVELAVLAVVVGLGVDGRTQELDEEGRDWVEETLPRFVRHLR